MYQFAHEKRASRGTQTKVSAGDPGLAIPEEGPRLSLELGADENPQNGIEQTSASQPTVTQSHLRHLMGVALTAPTAEAIIEFSSFASRL